MTRADFIRLWILALVAREATHMTIAQQIEAAEVAWRDIEHLLEET